MNENVIHSGVLSPVREQEQWLKCQTLAERYGMKLTRKQFEALGQARQQALEATGRLDFGGVADRLVYAFCDSAFADSEGFASLLMQVQELFYTFKNETLDVLTDEELISVMEQLFNGEAQGSLEYLSEVPPQRLVRIALRQVPQLLSGDLFAAYHQGQALLQEKGRRCQWLWQRVMETLPAVRSEALLSTLASIGSFFDHGDPSLPELSCTIDYPQMQPVPETLLGVDYLFQWLLQLRYENGIMGLFPTLQQEKILRRHCADYQQLPVNLCEPLLMAALGWQLLSPGRVPALALDAACRIASADREGIVSGVF